jgi:hypothetical protein
MTLAAVEHAILDACARRKFSATVVEPGLITARWENRGFLRISIPYPTARNSIRYKGQRAPGLQPGEAAHRRCVQRVRSTAWPSTSRRASAMRSAS